MNITTKKRALLARELGIALSDVEQNSTYDENLFDTDGGEYLVLTDEEADEAVEDYIMESLWAFDAGFIARHTKNGLSHKATEALREMQSALGEDANDIVLALIDDIDHFVQDAINADGRGHFLAHYDSEELDLTFNGKTEHFAYKVN